MLRGTAPWNTLSPPREHCLILDAGALGASAHLPEWLLCVHPTGEPDASRRKQPVPAPI